MRIRPTLLVLLLFMATSMSIAGNDYTTYMSFTGTFDFGTGTLVTVRHDDGASFELTDGTLPVEFSSPAETTAISDSFILSGVHPFELDYVAGQRYAVDPAGGLRGARGFYLGNDDLRLLWCGLHGLSPQRHSAPAAPRLMER